MSEEVKKRGFTEQEAAEYLCMSRSYLRQDRMNGIRRNRTPGPNYLKIGRTIRYLKEELDKWLEAYVVLRTEIDETEQET
jgi:predicted DNA-binding transcriptional regulator AlpA